MNTALHPLPSYSEASVRETEAVPAWATGVRRSVTSASTRGVDLMDTQFNPEPVERQGFQLLSAPGVVVVAVADSHPTIAVIERAKNVLREAAPDPLEIRAIALSPEFRLDPNVVNDTADEGFALVRDDGESALARARNYMSRVTRLRADALAHLDRQTARARLTR